jgi:hypothetical protein
VLLPVAPVAEPDGCMPVRAPVPPPMPAPGPEPLFGAASPLPTEPLDGLPAGPGDDDD